MKTVFDELREELESVQTWIDKHLAGPLPAKERQLVESLGKYVEHCRRDPKKWRSESEAMNARIKLKNA